MTAERNIEYEVLATTEEKKETKQQLIVDEIENKLSMVSGSLGFAMHHADNKDFYASMDHHIKSVHALLEQLRI